MGLIRLSRLGLRIGLILWLWNWVVLMADAKVRHFKWTVDYAFWSPDCVEKMVISINGEFPGPTIRAREGDTIVVELTNQMPTEGVVIHWHGIKQKGTPWYDGTSGVSQCAINPGETFKYRFLVDKAGTYFYHGHLGLQRSAGLYGALIVDLPHGQHEPFHYDGELHIMLNDWWHKSAYEQGLGLFSKKQFRWVNDSQSLLINGHGFYNCSLIENTNTTMCNNNDPQCARPVLNVQPGKTYRLRITSVTSLCSLNFQIEGHTMRVVEADGSYVKEVELENINIYSGETYSVLVDTLENPSQESFWMVAHAHGIQCSKTPPGLAIMSYSDNKVTPYTKPPPLPANDTTFNLAQSQLIRAHEGMVPTPPPRSDQQVILLNTQNKVDGVIKWAINNYSFVFPGTPILAAFKYGIKKSFDHAPPPSTYPYMSYNIFAPPQNPNASQGSRVYVFSLNSTVDIILQNANMLAPNKSEIHSWHVHGHNFWVLGFGDGIFDPNNHTSTFNIHDPPLRNTVPLYPYGWTAIRFIADNPGVWSFHCHIEAHFHMGMGILFAQGIDHLGHPPKSTLGCGLTKMWIP